ncbi:hypothetical protein A2U01_0102270, partial [Trifolium medium]|nr:hypothetical protein [Trifolium medium]
KEMNSGMATCHPTAGLP